MRSSLTWRTTVVLFLRRRNSPADWAWKRAFGGPTSKPTSPSSGHLWRGGSPVELVDPRLNHEDRFTIRHAAISSAATDSRQGKEHLWLSIFSSRAASSAPWARG